MGRTNTICDTQIRYGHTNAICDKQICYGLCKCDMRYANRLCAFSNCKLVFFGHHSTHIIQKREMERSVDRHEHITMDQTMHQQE